MTSTRAKRLMLALCLSPLFTPSAQAQSADTVQVYGQATAGFTSRNHVTNGGTLNEIGNNLLAASVLGFRGTENLGGGMSALFRLETGLNMDTGAPTSATKYWNRQSFVGMNIGPAVTVTLGRQFHAGADRAIQSMDVYNLGGTSLLNTPLGLFGVNRFAGNDTRVDNSIKLRVRGPMGLTGGLSTGLREETGRSVSADIAQITPAYVVGAYTIRFKSITPVATTGVVPEHAVWAVGGQLPLGAARLYLHYVNSSLDATVAGRRTQTNRILAPAASYQATDFLVLKAAYTHDSGKDLNGIADRNGSKNTTVLSAEYYLSKRTSLNAVLFRNQFTGGYKLESVNIAAMGRDPAASSMQGVSMGVRHDF